MDRSSVLGILLSTIIVIIMYEQLTKNCVVRSSIPISNSFSPFFSLPYYDLFIFKRFSCNFRKLF